MTSQPPSERLSTSLFLTGMSVYGGLYLLAPAFTRRRRRRATNFQGPFKLRELHSRIRFPSPRRRRRFSGCNGGQPSVSGFNLMSVRWGPRAPLLAGDGRSALSGALARAVTTPDRSLRRNPPSRGWKERLDRGVARVRLDDIEGESSQRDRLSVFAPSPVRSEKGAGGDTSSRRFSRPSIASRVSRIRELDYLVGDLIMDKLPRYIEPGWRR